MKAVVLESDDWGLCAWSADEEAHRALRDTPAYRSAAGRVYGRSTLESCEDVRRLCAVLEEVRGADGLSPVWQANTVIAAPDYSRLHPPDYAPAEFPTRIQPEAPSRWTRPGLWDQVRRAIERDLWWPELHGMLHIPASSWLESLRRGDSDSRLAFEQQGLICRAAESGTEFDAREPRELRERHLALAVQAFSSLFGRKPSSFCPPDYGWDSALTASAAGLGIIVMQGWVEQAGLRFSYPRRWLRRRAWPRRLGPLHVMPGRIAFEPRGSAGGGPLGARRALERIRRSWSAGRPAVLSTHRANYAHLDGEWSEAGRSQLRTLLDGIARAGGCFLVDVEVVQLAERGWSFRPSGPQRALLRWRGAARKTLRLPRPAEAQRAFLRPTRTGGTAPVGLEENAFVVEAEAGDYWVEWSAA